MSKALESRVPVKARWRELLKLWVPTQFIAKVMQIRGEVQTINSASVVDLASLGVESEGSDEHHFAG